MKEVTLRVSTDAISPVKIYLKNLWDRHLIAIFGQVPNLPFFIIQFPDENEWFLKKYLQFPKSYPVGCLEEKPVDFNPSMIPSDVWDPSHVIEFVNSFFQEWLQLFPFPNRKALFNLHQDAAVRLPAFQYTDEALQGIQLSDDLVIKKILLQALLTSPARWSERFYTTLNALFQAPESKIQAIGGSLVAQELRALIFIYRDCHHNMPDSEFPVSRLLTTPFPIIPNLAGVEQSASESLVKMVCGGDLLSKIAVDSYPKVCGLTMIACRQLTSSSQELLNIVFRMAQSDAVLRQNLAEAFNQTDERRGTAISTIILTLCKFPPVLFELLHQHADIRQQFSLALSKRDQDKNTVLDMIFFYDQDYSSRISLMALTEEHQGFADILGSVFHERMSDGKTTYLQKIMAMPALFEQLSANHNLLQSLAKMSPTPEVFCELFNRCNGNPAAQELMMTAYVADPQGRVFLPILGQNGNYFIQDSAAFATSLLRQKQTMLQQICERQLRDEKLRESARKLIIGKVMSQYSQLDFRAQRTLDLPRFVAGCLQQVAADEARQQAEKETQAAQRRQEENARQVAKQRAAEEREAQEAARKESLRKEKEEKAAQEKREKEAQAAQRRQEENARQAAKQRAAEEREAQEAARKALLRKEKEAKEVQRQERARMEHEERMAIQLREQEAREAKLQEKAAKKAEFCEVLEQALHPLPKDDQCFLRDELTREYVASVERRGAFPAKMNDYVTSQLVAHLDRLKTVQNDRVLALLRAAAIPKEHSQRFCDLFLSQYSALASVTPEKTLAGLVYEFLSQYWARQLEALTVCCQNLTNMSPENKNFLQTEVQRIYPNLKIPEKASIQNNEAFVVNLVQSLEKERDSIVTNTLQLQQFYIPKNKWQEFLDLFKIKRPHLSILDQLRSCCPTGPVQAVLQEYAELKVEEVRNYGTSYLRKRMPDFEEVHDQCIDRLIHSYTALSLGQQVTIDPAQFVREYLDRPSAPVKLGTGIFAPKEVLAKLPKDPSPPKDDSVGESRCFYRYGNDDL